MTNHLNIIIEYI